MGGLIAFTSIPLLKSDLESSNAAAGSPTTRGTIWEVEGGTEDDRAASSFLNPSARPRSPAPREGSSSTMSTASAAAPAEAGEGPCCI